MNKIIILIIVLFISGQVMSQDVIKELKRINNFNPFSDTNFVVTDTLRTNQYFIASFHNKVQDYKIAFELVSKDEYCVIHLCSGKGNDFELLGREIIGCIKPNHTWISPTSYYGQGVKFKK